MKQANFPQIINPRSFYKIVDRPWMQPIDSWSDSRRWDFNPKYGITGVVHTASCRSWSYGTSGVIVPAAGAELGRLLLTADGSSISDDGKLTTWIGTAYAPLRLKQFLDMTLAFVGLPSPGLPIASVRSFRTFSSGIPAPYGAGEIPQAYGIVLCVPPSTTDDLYKDIHTWIAERGLSLSNFTLENLAGWAKDEGVYSPI